MGNNNETNDLKLELKNHMEDVVVDVLESMLPSCNVCQCKMCRNDIIAYALNHLAPKYTVTNKGDIYSRISEFTQQFEIDVQVALTEAIKVVSNNPRH
jgi:competence protein ComFB